MRDEGCGLRRVRMAAQLVEAARTSINATLKQLKHDACIQGTFESSHTFERRLAESKRILQKYPERIPVILEKAKRSEAPSVDKQKYLVPADLTVGQFVYVVRKRVKLEPQEAIYLFVGDILPPAHQLLSQVYKDYKNLDGFLYVTYAKEATFGN